MMNLNEHMLEEEKRLLEIENNIKDLEKKIDQLSVDVSDLVSAWKAAGWVVSAVKYLAGAAIAVGAIVTYLKGFK